MSGDWNRLAIAYRSGGSAANQVANWRSIASWIHCWIQPPARRCHLRAGTITAAARQPGAGCRVNRATAWRDRGRARSTFSACLLTSGQARSGRRNRYALRNSGPEQPLPGVPLDRGRIIDWRGHRGRHRLSLSSGGDFPLNMGQTAKVGLVKAKLAFCLQCAGRSEYLLIGAVNVPPGRIRDKSLLLLEAQFPPFAGYVTSLLGTLAKYVLGGGTIAADGGQRRAVPTASNAINAALIDADLVLSPLIVRSIPAAHLTVRSRGCAGQRGCARSATSCSTSLES